MKYINTKAHVDTSSNKLSFKYEAQEEGGTIIETKFSSHQRCYKPRSKLPMSVDIVSTPRNQPSAAKLIR